jgi:hypothetical protein
MQRRPRGGAIVIARRKKYGGLNVDQAKRLQPLEDKNGWLKKLVADLSLEKQVLRDMAQGKLSASCLRNGDDLLAEAATRNPSDFARASDDRAVRAVTATL